VDPGALLSAATGATQSAQPVVDITDLSRVRVFIYPGQQDAVRTHEGDKVTFWTDADPNKKREAQISRLTHALDPRTRTMLAEFDVDNAGDSIQPGSFVHVQLTLAGGAGSVVPADAIVLRGGKSFVAGVANGHARFVPVDVVDDDGKQVVISRGVGPGDVVILHPSDDVIDGGIVHVVDPTVVATRPAAARP
jgi:multidrug efflux pump subunit AcrA (membrane-fusion protein)